MVGLNFLCSFTPAHSSNYTVELIEVTQHVCSNQSTSGYLDKTLGSSERRTFGHLYNDCSNHGLFPSGDESGATSCFGGWRKVTRVCGASIDLQMPNDDVCSVESGSNPPCDDGLPYPAYSLGPGLDWRMWYSGTVQACTSLINGSSGNLDGLSPSLSDTSVNFLCSVDREWTMDDTLDESEDTYFMFTYCWIGGESRNGDIEDDDRGNNYYYQDVIASDCSNGLPDTNDDDDVLCVASVVDVSYSGAEEDVIVYGM